MLRTDHLVLRDFTAADIEKRIYWETVETEWQLWDAPWEYEGLTEKEKTEEYERYLNMLHKWAEQRIPEHGKRNSFQIETIEGQAYIGWVSSYRIDEEYNYRRGAGYCTVGINIPDMSARGKGYAYEALGAFISYLIEQGECEIYTQTWSGNERMIHIAEKIGFEECCRKEGIRSVRGRTYDGLTFQLNMQKFFGGYRTCSCEEDQRQLNEKR